MRFHASLINQYYKKWQSQSPIVLSQSNPQPLTLEELESIIGSTENLFDQKEALDYSTVQGDETLRSVIAELYDQNNAENIATFAGAQEAIFCATHSLVEPGDKVVAITPIFEPLIKTAQDIGCEIELISLQTHDQWELDLNQLEDAINDDCKLLILNFPHNPTGAMISEEQLLQIINICERNNCWILSDEVFRGLEHMPEDRLPAVSDLYEKSISIGVLSKAFALPALRIGWISCQNKKVLDQTLQVKDYLSICNSFLDEKLATRVIPHHDQIWERNRKLITNNLDQLNKHFEHYQNKFKLSQPQAGCTGFPIIKDDQTATEFSEQLIRSKKLMVLPDELFLTELNGFRLGFGHDHHAENYRFLL